MDQAVKAIMQTLIWGGFMVRRCEMCWSVECLLETIRSSVFSYFAVLLWLAVWTYVVKARGGCSGPKWTWWRIVTVTVVLFAVMTFISHVANWYWQLKYGW